MVGLVSRTGVLRLSYRDKPISSCFKLFLTKKPVEFDYVAVDANALVATALRMSKNVNDPKRRNREVGRQVLHGLHQLLRRVSCRRSLLLALDGAETMAKADLTRHSSVTRKLESRLARLPATPLMQAIEERLVRSMPDPHLHIDEVVIAGTGVQGCVEQKMCAWALDLACRNDTDDDNGEGTSRSMCMIGANELYLCTLALTPFYNLTNIVQSGSDLRQIAMPDLLDWLGVEQYVARGNSSVVASARTDMLFLYLLSSGCSATDLPALAQTNLVSLLDAYHQEVLRSDASASTTGSGGEGRVRATSVDGEEDGANEMGDSDASSSASLARSFLFTDVPGNSLRLDVKALIRVLTPHSRRGASGDSILGEGPGSATVQPTPTAPLVESYLEHALQTHALFCLGYMPSTTSPSTYLHAKVDVACSVVVKHLQRLSAFGVRYLTAKESATTCPSPQPSTADTKAAAAPPSSSARVPLRTSEVAPSDGHGAVAEDEERVTTGHDRASTTPSAAEAAPAPHDLSDSSASAPLTDLVDEKVETAQGQTEDVSTVVVDEAALAAQVGAAFWSPSQPLTAAEYTILCHSVPQQIDMALHQLVGVPPLPEVSKRIAQADTAGARRMVQEALSYADPEHPHKSLCFSPSYCWAQSARSKLWGMRYIELGARARQREIRRERNAVSGLSMKLSTSEEDGPATFENGAWQPVLRFPWEREGDSRGGAGPAPPDTLKLLTWNVMFDRYSGKPTPLGMPGIDWCSPQRYPVLARRIEAEDADVVGLQEVEAPFAAYLAAQPWCQERYMLSCTANSAVLSPWGVLMLVHKRCAPVEQLTHYNLPAWAGHISLMPTVTLRMRHGPVHVAALHLLAPFTRNNVTARTGQDGVLRQRLTKGLTGDCVAMGDFNDWPTSEFLMPVETQYVECWPLVHPNDPGKTMDDTNRFCQLKVEEMFFGRSDKVFLRSARLQPVEAHLVGTRSVNEENGNTDAPAYLFPSDHYGVSVTLKARA